jgi:hypothetical protein
MSFSKSKLCDPNDRYVCGGTNYAKYEFSAGTFGFKCEGDIDRGYKRT